MRLASLLIVALFAVSTATADHHKDKKKADAVCPVMGKAIDKSISTEHNGGTVYFCCAKCVGKFESNTDKYAAKANHQLVATGQAEQTRCPVTGAKLNPEKTHKVAGVEVQFCCGNCQGKVAKAEEKKAIEMVFSDKAFKKAFEVEDES